MSGTSDVFPKPEKRGPKPKRPLVRNRKPIQRSRLKAKGKPSSETRARAVCRLHVYARDKGMCRACWMAGEQVHEEPSRAQGGDPTNPDDCLLVCAECHRKITGDVGVKWRVTRLGATCADRVRFEVVVGPGAGTVWEG